jgi:hypothetical protein
MIQQILKIIVSKTEVLKITNSSYLLYYAFPEINVYVKLLSSGVWYDAVRFGETYYVHLQGNHRCIIQH